MAKSKSLLRALNSILPFADFLYLLQLEEYYSSNYSKRAMQFFFRRNIQKRGRLDWTNRIKATFAVSLFVFALALTLPTYLLEEGRTLFLAASVILGCILVPVWVGLANLIVGVPASIVKSYVRNKAKKFVEVSNPKAKVIAIVGSFGKTTTKNFIYQLIRYNYKVQMVEGNINTPVGIARWLLDNLDMTAQIILVEMDAYEAGEIAQSSKILPPDIFIITSIGDQHISRFGNAGNMAAALLEVAGPSKKGSKGVMSESANDLIHSLGLENLVQGKETAIVPENRLVYQGAEISPPDIMINEPSLALALKVAEILEIPKDFVLSNIKELTAPPRRHQLTEKDGYKVIDDSYNVSFTTAKCGVRSAKSLASKLGLRLVVITGGIPESGDLANFEYGKFLKDEVRDILVLNTRFKEDIVGSFDRDRVLTANNLDEAWDLLKKRFRPNETLVLLQPELTDLSY